MLGDTFRSWERLGSVLIDGDLESMSGDETLSSREAAALLGVKLATLYAYTSRGLVRSLPAAGGRSRRYVRHDLESLLRRREARRGPRAAGALRLGEPVLDSGVTDLSQHAGPLYRGRAAVELASSGIGFEAVAELLWSGELPDQPVRWDATSAPSEIDSLDGLTPFIPADTPPLHCLALVLPVLAARDPGRFDTRAAATLKRARSLIPRLAAAFGLRGGSGRFGAALSAGSVAQTIARALGTREDAPAIALIDKTLVLMADHELNASAFAARVAASTEADLHACLSAAVATLGGPLHGSASERFEAVVLEAARPERAERTVHERLRRGEHIAGFGHLIYRAADPRAIPLLRAARELAPEDDFIATAVAVIEAMQRAERPAPNADVALACVSAALGLPSGSSPALFGIARCAGWVAHVLEQYEAGFLMRPRARFLAPD